MLFSSITFLFYFLPFTILGYFLIKERHKNLFLWIVSLFFYAWGEPIYVGLLLISAGVDFSAGLFIEKYPHYAKKGLIASIVINLSLLLFFKYTPLIQDFLSLFSLHLPLAEVALPLGISFYTFQTMSYTIDVYRGNVKANHSFIDFAMYIAMFPQLIAGPIVRYVDVVKDIKKRSYSYEQFEAGITRFMIGLGKKVLLANAMGAVFEELQSLSTISLIGSWFAMIAFAFQIYFDFSGYSDMAIGLGKIFGFHFPENFNYPYSSKSISEFWRRWHISLSTWFKEYVYIPLGGNRRHPVRNLIIVWFLCGLWHGAALNYILWGLYFGCLLIIEKYALKDYLKKLPSFLQHFLTIFFILVGWTIFAFEDGGELLLFLESMFFNTTLVDMNAIYIMTSNSVLFIVCACFSMPLLPWLKKRYQLPDTVRQIVILCIFILCTAYICDASYNPFLYFRF